MRARRPHTTVWHLYLGLRAPGQLAGQSPGRRFIIRRDRAPPIGWRARARVKIERAAQVAMKLVARVCSLKFATRSPELRNRGEQTNKRAALGPRESLTLRARRPEVRLLSPDNFVCSTRRRGNWRFEPVEPSTQAAVVGPFLRSLSAPLLNEFSRPADQSEKSVQASRRALRVLPGRLRRAGWGSNFAPHQMIGAGPAFNLS